MARGFEVWVEAFLGFSAIPFASYVHPTARLSNLAFLEHSCVYIYMWQLVAISAGVAFMTFPPSTQVAIVIQEGQHHELPAPAVAYLSALRIANA